MWVIERQAGRLRIGAQTATFQIQGAVVPTGATLTIDKFAVQGATALETPIPVAAALPIAMQATNNSLISNNDAAPLTRGAFAAEPGIKSLFVGAVQFIDLGSPTLGTKFGTNPSSDSDTAVLSAIELSAELVDTATGTAPVLTPSGTPNALSTSDTATVTISGLFSGIATVFWETASSDCLHPAIAGTVTPTSATFPNVPFNQEVFFCVTATGTSLLRDNPQGFNPTVAPGTSTDFLGAACAPGVCNEFPGLWTYFGGGVVEVTNFFTGDDSGYTSLLRVNNAGTAAATLYAVVQPDTGGPQLTGLIGALGAGMGTVFTEAQVQADVPGMNLANSGQRATLELIVAGELLVAPSDAPVAPSAARHLTDGQAISLAQHFPAGRGALPAVPGPPPIGVVSASGLLVNPSGAVTQMPKAGLLSPPPLL